MDKQGAAWPGRRFLLPCSLALHTAPQQPGDSPSLIEAGSTSIRLLLCARHWEALCVHQPTQPPGGGSLITVPACRRGNWGVSEAARPGLPSWPMAELSYVTVLHIPPAPAAQTSVEGIFPSHPCSPEASEEGCSLKERPEEQKPGGWDHPARMPTAPLSGLKEQAGWAPPPLGEPSGRQALRAELSTSSLLPMAPGRPESSLPCPGPARAHLCLLCMASCHPSFPDPQHIPLHAGDASAAATEQRQVIILGSP